VRGNIVARDNADDGFEMITNTKKDKRLILEIIIILGLLVEV
jgi:hypothetical protein